VIAKYTHAPYELESFSNARDANRWVKADKAKAGVSFGWMIAAKLHSQMRQVSTAAERRRIRMIRISPGTLDDDNLRGAFKAIRDGIAKFFGVNDGDQARWQWEYDQEKGPSRKKDPRNAYAIRVEYEVMS